MRHGRTSFCIIHLGFPSSSSYCGNNRVPSVWFISFVVPWRKMAHYHSYPQATERNPLGIHTHRFCILFRPATRLYVFTLVRNRTQDQNWLPRLTSSSYHSPVKCFVCTGTFKQVMLNFLHIHFHSPYHTIYFSALCNINSWNNATSNKRHEVNQNVWYSLLFF